MNVSDAVRRRRSIKRFTARPLDPEELAGLLELVVLAPNHRMTEPWRFVVLGPRAKRAWAEIKGESRAGRVDDAEVAEAIRRRTIEDIESLPGLIAFIQPLADAPDVREEDYATLYMGIQNLLLGAVDLGLGTHVKTGGELEGEGLREALGVGDGERVVALVQIGEPAELPAPKPRTAATHRTTWLP